MGVMLILIYSSFESVRIYCQRNIFFCSVKDGTDAHEQEMNKRGGEGECAIHGERKESSKMDEPCAAGGRRHAGAYARGDTP